MNLATLLKAPRTDVDTLVLLRVEARVLASGLLSAAREQVHAFRFMRGLLLGEYSGISSR